MGMLLDHENKLRKNLNISQIFVHKSHYGFVNGSVHTIWTKYGRNILLDHRNKPDGEFLIRRKIQDGRLGRHYNKLRNRL